MSSGQKQLVTNTRERALSTDQNRSEAFIARDRSQLARFLYNDTRQNTYQYPGVAKQNVGGEVPLSADVFGGLMVDPQATSLLITPGEIGCLFPDPSITADDSPYMLIDDPGQQTAGILTFTANASGQIRIDLVECQPVSTILETDNRDIFNPSTGLFAPATVTKVQAFRLQYRIRTGTGGAGIPALVAGWLPLAAIVMPSGAADFNACDFYDVRPLVEERVRPQPAGPSGGFNTAQYCPVRNAEYFSQVVTGATTVQGFSETQFGGYIAGGWLRRSSPNSSGTFGGTGVNDGDASQINVSIADNQVTGFAPVAAQIVYLVAYFPAQLPRWVRYSEVVVGGGFGRIPQGPRGIILASTATPLKNGIVTPMTIGHGFGGGHGGVVLGTLVYNSGGTDFVPVNANGGLHSNQSAPINFAVSRISTSQVDFALVAGTHYPANASEIQVQIQVTLDNSGSFDAAFLKVVTTNGAIGANVLLPQSVPVPAGSTTVAINVRVPLISRTSPVDAGGPSTTVSVTLSGPVGVTFSATASIHHMFPYGWKLGS